MELIEGCHNKAEMEQLFSRLAPFQVIWASESDCWRALANFARVRLTIGLDILDALIAECAVGLGARLCTCNQKHMKAIPGLILEKHYKRQ